jgi:hypothetical protein
MGSKIVFFFLHQKGTQVKANQVRKTNVIQLVKGYQNHHHMALHDHPFVKKMGGQKSHFFIFSIF